MSLVLMVPASLCQLWCLATEQLWVGERAACCHPQPHVTGDLVPDPVPTAAGIPTVLCPKGWPQTGQKTGGDGSVQPPEAA